MAEQIIDPGIVQTKHRITRVGDLRVNEEGKIDIFDWLWTEVSDLAPPGTRFDSQWDQEMRMHGWHVWELHDIAHGWPCGCGIDRVLRDAGFEYPYKRGPL